MGQEQGTFGINAGQAALNVGSGIVGTAAGYIFAGMNDRRQIRQQKKLNQLAMDSNKEMANYNYDLEMKKWNDTNYSAQMEQLNKAGLNPALLYGMSGGGGQTAQTKGAEGVGTSQAPSGGGEIMAMQQYALQNRMTEAQIKLAESQAEKNKVEAAKTAGVDTQLTTTQISSLTQGIENQKAVQKLTEIQTDITKIDKTIKADTQTDVTDQITNQARKTQQELEILISQNLITTEQAVNAKQTAAAQLAGLQLQNDVQRKNLQLTDQEIEKLQADIKNTTNLADMQLKINDLPKSVQTIIQTIFTLLHFAK